MDNTRFQRATDAKGNYQVLRAGCAILPRLWSRYKRRISSQWATKVQAETEARVLSSQSKFYKGHGKRKAMAPVGWYTAPARFSSRIRVPAVWDDELLIKWVIVFKWNASCKFAVALTPISLECDQMLSSNLSIYNRPIKPLSIIDLSIYCSVD